MNRFFTGAHPTNFAGFLWVKYYVIVILTRRFLVLIGPCVMMNLKFSFLRERLDIGTRLPLVMRGKRSTQGRGSLRPRAVA